MKRSLLAAVALAAFAPLAQAAPPSTSAILADSVDVLDDLAALQIKGIPPALLADAQGVAIIPRVIKAGFVFAGRGGYGVVMTKDKTGNWAPPVFIAIGGASVGFQAGVESTDVVLVFRGRKSLDRILEGKDKLTLGGDAAIAAGPVGRQAAVATDGKLEAEIVSYSRSRGLFAGVSLDGAVISNDRIANDDFRKHATEKDLKRAGDLATRLNKMGAPLPTSAAELLPPAPVRK